MKRFLVFVLLLFLFTLSPAVSAHPGKTDGNGGHWNHSTGEYHFHTGEYAGRNSSKSTFSSYSNFKPQKSTNKENNTPSPGFPIAMILIIACVIFFVLYCAKANRTKPSKERPRSEEPTPSKVVVSDLNKKAFNPNISKPTIAIVSLLCLLTLSGSFLISYYVAEDGPSIFSSCGSESIEHETDDDETSKFEAIEQAMNGVTESERKESLEALGYSRFETLMIYNNYMENNPSEAERLERRGRKYEALKTSFPEITPNEFEAIEKAVRSGKKAEKLEKLKELGYGAYDATVIYNRYTKTD